MKLSDNYKKLLNNLSYLVIIEALNKLLPILVLPYIINIIGIEKYGILAFSLALIMYFKILSAYSFDLTATKFIAEHKHNQEKVSAYYWNVIFTKLLLLTFSFLLLLIGISLFPTLQIIQEVLLFTFLMVIGEVLTPLWFFRGIEKMKYVAYISITTKLIYTISIFILIDKENDYLIVPLLNSISYLLVGVLTLVYIHKKFKILFILPQFNNIKKLLLEGKDIFLSNISVAMYTTTNSILLGFLVGYTAVGIYAMAEAIYGACLQLIYTYNTVVYPHLAKYLNNQKKFVAQAKKLFLFYVVLLVFVALSVYLSSELIVNFLFEKSSYQTIEILHILSFSLILMPIGAYLTHYLALKSDYKTIRKITFLTMLVNFILVYPLLIQYAAKGMAYLMVIVALVQVFLNIKHNQEIFTKKNKF